MRLEISLDLPQRHLGRLRSLYREGMYAAGGVSDSDQQRFVSGNGDL
jgi:hypothetical protein